MSNNRREGIDGEVLARSYLLNEGYIILASNYKTKFGEIDIIAENNNLLIFIEVKKRTSLEYGEGREAVGYIRRQRYVRTALQYTVSHHKTECDCRFDVIEIYNGQINHIIDAFRA